MDVCVLQCLCRCGVSALTAAYVLSWVNLPIVAVIALLVPVYMFSGGPSAIALGDKPYGAPIACDVLHLVLHPAHGSMVDQLACALTMYLIYCHSSSICTATM
jgi:hypothetical protein